MKFARRLLSMMVRNPCNLFFLWKSPFKYFPAAFSCQLESFAENLTGSQREWGTIIQAILWSDQSLWEYTASEQGILNSVSVQWCGFLLNLCKWIEQLSPFGFSFTLAILLHLFTGFPPKGMWPSVFGVCEGYPTEWLSLAVASGHVTETQDADFVSLTKILCGLLYNYLHHCQELMK
jgi:hypothetical protein